MSTHGLRIIAPLHLFPIDSNSEPVNAQDRSTGTSDRSTIGQQGEAKLLLCYRLASLSRFGSANRTQSPSSEVDTRSAHSPVSRTLPVRGRSTLLVPMS